MKTLVNEYNKKIEALDFGIDALTEKIRKVRHSGSTSEYILDTQDFVNERNILNTKRQLYIQFLKDLEDLNH